MRLLCFQAKRFRWKTHSKTLADVPDYDLDEQIEDSAVVFVHAEASDGKAARRDSVLRQSLKHVKWLANKRNLRNIVLHSFAHLGGQSAPPDVAEPFINALDQHLRGAGYEVKITPFGYFYEWDLSVYGESLAKVWKEIQSRSDSPLPFGLSELRKRGSIQSGDAALPCCDHARHEFKRER